MQNASQALTPTTDKYEQSPAQAPLPTFLDHVHELRRRLFWVVAVVLVVSAVAYGFLNDVISLLTAPLGDKQLYYLTPAGGLTFTFKLCSFIGFVVGVPVLMYHIYRFLEPLMGTKRKSAVFYVGLSTVFAAAGVLFAYYISLPAALHFLTNFNLGNIQAMLTVDSYLSFVVTYLLGAALLFQIPLLLLIINTMTPLQPNKLMKLQKFVIVGAFILAAVISPTPDIMNQTFLALPIIAMYQLGVLLVWLQYRSAARQNIRQQLLHEETREGFMPIEPKSIPRDILADFVTAPQPTAPTPAVPAVARKPVPAPAPARVPSPQAVQPAVPVVPASAASFRGKPIRHLQQLRPQPQVMVRPVAHRPVRPMTDITRPRVRAQPVVRPVIARSHPQATRRTPQLSVPARSIDGFMRPSPATYS
ncbi:MAG TPA: twin-arginine translocase subunit TatC [Candidatus Saccharimonadales bacterium]|nr:twin-arginine translocase subunit TatC [Candidatus Saccharimonadales bacterium]